MGGVCRKVESGNDGIGGTTRRTGKQATALACLSTASDGQNVPAECGLMWVLLGKQRGLTTLRTQQGQEGMFLDSCYTGASMCGSARWESIKSSGVLRILRKLDEVEHVRFGGGAAASIGVFEIELPRGRNHR